eukprot:Opistho-1_new@104209
MHTRGIDRNVAADEVNVNEEALPGKRRGDGGLDQDAGVETACALAREVGDGAANIVLGKRGPELRRIRPGQRVAEENGLVSFSRPAKVIVRVGAHGLRRFPAENHAKLAHNDGAKRPTCRGNVRLRVPVDECENDAGVGLAGMHRREQSVLVAGRERDGSRRRQPRVRRNVLDAKLARVGALVREAAHEVELVLDERGVLVAGDRKGRVEEIGVLDKGHIIREKDVRAVLDRVHERSSILAGGRACRAIHKRGRGEDAARDEGDGAVISRENERARAVVEVVAEDERGCRTSRQRAAHEGKQRRERNNSARHIRKPPCTLR